MTVTVAEIMTSELVCLEPKDTLEQVSADMERYRIRHLPVIADGVLVGLITHRDLLGAFAFGKQDATVSEIMRRKIATIHPTATVAEAGQILVDGKFGCLPVVETTGELVGIVTEHDMLRLLVNTLLLEELHESDVKKSMAALRSRA